MIAAYLADLGRGFIKDDFAWILGSRTAGPLGFIDLFGRDNGFYRPLVSLTSFASVLKRWLATPFARRTRSRTAASVVLCHRSRPKAAAPLPLRRRTKRWRESDAPV